MSTTAHQRLYQVLVAPQVSEKSTRLAEAYNQVVFRVALNAKKPEIKAAVEFLFNVEVMRVQTAVVGGKIKRFSKMLGKRKDWKKAYVTLKPGQEIDISPAI